ncbi:unnamed protein product [Cladocopium goreaui]|uniref:C3H1-type domain-containing protein n=1 Tax=Cladocopium goreaui TaxID=2562237 RepID=A0A9P1DB49_9DINO|nr:unnamed protein product [Cladocopium goreaui]|mmetsp:Transcript_46753/g.101815  ORF Transcript_46753/g.101815 Transcript_46753/m.101815 type:complete len:193 (+) Transcript_46753:67-645(+)
MEQETTEAQSSSDESSVSKWVCGINAFLFSEFTEFTGPTGPTVRGEAPIESYRKLGSRDERWAAHEPGLLGERDAADHAQRRCSPCIFHNSLLGCDRGSTCDFCHDVHPAGVAPKRPRKQMRDKLKLRIEESLHLPDDQLQDALQPTLEYPYARGLIRGILDARAGADLAPLEPGEVANHQAEIRSRSVNPN